jgi:hypothetical protein
MILQLIMAADSGICTIVNIIYNTVPARRKRPIARAISYFAANAKVYFLLSRPWVLISIPVLRMNTETMCIQERKQLWVGWAYLTKTVRKLQRGEVNFDPPMIFFACSTQNPPAASEMPPGDFRTEYKVLPSSLREYQ